jgi:hypothetical protein
MQTSKSQLAVRARPWLALVLGLLLPGVALAQPAFDYNFQPRTLKACRLLIPYAKGGGWPVQGSDSYSLVLEGMRRFPGKPAGWELENPLAPAAIERGRTPEIIHKSNEAYWEVALNNQSAAQLAVFDLIYIHAGGVDGDGDPVRLNIHSSVWRNGLLKAVHEGAVVWVDQHYDGTTVDNFCPPGSVLSGSGSPFAFSAAAPSAGFYRRSTGESMLLHFPYRLGELSDVQYLGRYPRAVNAVIPPPAGYAASQHFIELLDPNLQEVVQVGDGAWAPFVAVMRYGAGAVVVTAGDVGFDVVNWWSGAGRNQPLPWEAADCKFAWNVAGMASSWGAQQGGGSQRGTSLVQMAGPLGVNWQYPDRFESRDAVQLGSVVSSPVTDSGMVFALALGRNSGAPRLMCFDADPASDLDGDGQSDDGIPDYSTGTSYDMVWEADLGPLSGALNYTPTPRYSSPTLVSLAGLAGGRNLQGVLVSLVRPNGSGGVAGQVRCYNATFDPKVLGAPEVQALPAAYRTPGALLWTRTIEGYGGSSQVVDLTTPVVYKDYVYVVASEYDPSLGSGVAGTYGRAHCFQLSYRWDLNGNGAQWSFPDATDDPALDGDTAADDNATPEHQKSIPPLQEPGWVAGVNDGANNYNPRPILPPCPTITPVVEQPSQPSIYPRIDAFLHFSTPVSFVWEASSNTVSINSGGGGADFVLLPMPRQQSAPYNDTTNQFNWAYSLASLPAGETPTSIIVTRADAPSIDVTADWVDIGGGAMRAVLQSRHVRELLLPSAAGSDNPLTASYYRSIRIEYSTASDGPWTLDTTLYGPMRFGNPLRSYGAGERPVASRSVERSLAAAPTHTLENDDGSITAPVPTFIYGRPVYSSASEWRLRSRNLLPDPGARGVSARGGVALDRNTETGVLAVGEILEPDSSSSRQRVAQVVGLNTVPIMEVNLLATAGSPTPEARLHINSDHPVFVRTVPLDLAAGPVNVPSRSGSAVIWDADADSRTLRFTPLYCGWVNGTIGPLWGKPIWVTYSYVRPPNFDNVQTVTDELYILPDIVRYQVSPGLIRLNNPVVRAGSITVTLPNGVPVTGVAEGEAPYMDALGGNPGWGEGFLPEGLLEVIGDLRIGVPPATGPDTREPLRPGSEIAVSYIYWNPVSRTEEMVTGERHQIPLRFGVPQTTASQAGDTAHVGTEIYRPDGMRGAGNWVVNNDLYWEEAPGGPILGLNGGRKSLLSVRFDPLSRIVKSALSQVAFPEPVTYGVGGLEGDQGTPVVSSPAAIGPQGVVVGSRLMTRLEQTVSYQGQDLGFVSSLSPQRTLVADNTRLVECIGQTPSWVCLGSQAPSYHQAFNPATEGIAEMQTTPFRRPAKATYLPGGSILVADTGNNRVIEIDRQGRQLWPLDDQGFDYYTSSQNSRLSLQRPSDCWRYYVVRERGTGAIVSTSPHGKMQYGTGYFTEAHTVVADLGNGRVVDIISTVGDGGDQRHAVHVLTPSHVRLATQSGMAQISYSRAQPIFDPLNGNVIGYLCAASNLHQLVVVEAGTKTVNPIASSTPFYGSPGSTWAWWAWLYDSDVTDGNHAPDDPLIFRNLRDVRYVREGSLAYLTVTCGQYAGRLRKVEAGTAHSLANEGAGVFEFQLWTGGAPGTWGLVPAASGGETRPDDPMWHFTQLDYRYGNNERRPVSNVLYDDGGTLRWLDMGWNPVSAMRIAGDRRATGNDDRMQYHLITNYAQLVQNMNRANVVDHSAPASLFSNVFVVATNDYNNVDPYDDRKDIDRREVIPDPNELDWPDPLNQPAYAERY